MFFEKKKLTMISKLIAFLVVLLSNIEIKIYWIFLDQSKLTYKACMNNLVKINWYVQSSINLILKDKIDKKKHSV
jgi:hypothetical protein